MGTQSKIFKYLINELALKKAVTYTFTGFLALASHGRVSGRFRASKNDQSVEIEITGNDRSPLTLKATPISSNDNNHLSLLEMIQEDLDHASTELDRYI